MKCMDCASRSKVRARCVGNADSAYVLKIGKP